MRQRGVCRRPQPNDPLPTWAIFVPMPLPGHPDSVGEGATRSPAPTIPDPQAVGNPEAPSPGGGQHARRPGPAAGQVVQEGLVDDPSGKPAPTESPSAPGPRGDFHSVWLSIPITSRIYAFDRRDRLCYGPDCYLWTFERSPTWYYQSKTPLPPLRRQGEAYYVDTQAVLELAQNAPGTRLPRAEQAQNRP